MNDAKLLPPGVTPRPDKGDREERLSIPMRETEKRRFLRLCQALNVSMSAVSRSLINQWMDEVEERLAKEASRKGAA